MMFQYRRFLTDFIVSCMNGKHLSVSWCAASNICTFSTMQHLLCYNLSSGFKYLSSWFFYFISNDAVKDWLGLDKCIHQIRDTI